MACRRVKTAGGVENERLVTQKGVAVAGVAAVVAHRTRLRRKRKERQREHKRDKKQTAPPRGAADQISCR